MYKIISIIERNDFNILIYDMILVVQRNFKQSNKEGKNLKILNLLHQKIKPRDLLFSFFFSFCEGSLYRSYGICPVFSFFFFSKTQV